jgi:hypothetical protein
MCLIVKACLVTGGSLTGRRIFPGTLHTEPVRGLAVPYLCLAVLCAFSLRAAG